MRARRWCHEGYRYEGACEAEMSPLATSGVWSSPHHTTRFALCYPFPPVDYVYYSLYDYRIDS